MTAAKATRSGATAHSTAVQRRRTNSADRSGVPFSLPAWVWAVFALGALVTVLSALVPVDDAAAAPDARSTTATRSQVAPPAPVVTIPVVPSPGGSPTAPAAANDNDVSVSLDLGGMIEDSDPNATGEARKPSRSIVILLLLTLLSVAPSLMIMMTSFTRMVVVLSIARNAIGLQSIPPNQVITGLALFLSLFVMQPTLKEMNDQALQPYLRGDITQAQALPAAERPLKEFMLANTRREELQLMVEASKAEKPDDPMDLSMSVIIPAFVLSELKSAFIIGVMVLLPFLIIDLVVGAGLMSLGMMMLPPVFVSLPFKLLLFVMVDGWALIAHALISNYNGP